MNVQLKRNDTLDIIDYTIRDEDNQPVNLSGSTVKFVMGKKNKMIVNSPAIIDNAASGEVSYQLKPEDTLVSGNFQAEFEVTFSDGKVKTYPNNGYIIVTIQPNLDNNKTTIVVDLIAKQQGEFEQKLDDILKLTGDGNPEIVNARGGFPVLRDRLDKSLGISPEQFGAKGDGVTDDTQAFLTATSLMNQYGYCLRLIPNAKYVLKLPLYFGSETKIYANGAEIVWKGISPIDNSSRTLGIINFDGTSESSNKKTISAINLQEPLLNNDGTKLPFYGSVTVPGHTYIIGDYIVIEVESGVYNTTVLNPKIRQMVKIVRVEGDKLFVDYTNPFPFNMVNVTSAKVYKCVPAKNIVIDNLYINDELVITEPKDGVNTHPNRSQFMVGIVLRLCTNIQINNVRAYNTKFPVVLAMMCSHGKVTNGYLDKPAIVGPGEGYYAQINSSKEFILENVQGENTRHIIDFTYSSFCEVRKARGNKGYGVDFQSHGAYEHNITYRECVGSFNFASGEEFGNAVMNYKLDNCKGTLLCKYSKDITIVDSDFTLVNGLTSTDVRNSKIRLHVDNTSADSRSSVSDRKLHFNGCQVKLYSPNYNGAFIDYDSISFKNGELIDFKKETEGYLSGYMLQMKNVGKLTIDGNHNVDNIRIRIENTTKDIEFNFNKNSVLCHATDYHLTSKNTTNIKIISQIEGNVFKNGKGDGTRFKLMRLPANDTQTNTQSIVNFKDNYVHRGEILAQVTSTADVYISRDNVLKDCLVTVDAGIAHKVQNDITLV